MTFSPTQNSFLAFSHVELLGYSHGQMSTSEPERAMKAVLFTFSSALALAANLSGAAAFSGSFRWCSKMPHSNTSPAFTLSGAPKGTVSLTLMMTDHQASYDHGGGTIPYRGGSIPCGAIANGWVGPFPPNGEVHTYEFTIEARGGSGKVIATAHAVRKFPE